MDTNNVLEIVRPSKVTVAIYGQTYEVRRIRYPAMIKIVALIADVLYKGGLVERIQANKRLVATDIMEVVITQVGLLETFCKLIMDESLPEFKDSADLSVEDMMLLVQKLWEVNQLTKAFERFFAQMGTQPQVNPVE